jgi:hypothetical protein
MYNTKVVCTYNTDEVFKDSDNISEEEKEFIRDAIYRQELLDILGMSEFNESEMNRSIHELYEKIKDNKELKECMTKCAGRFLSEDLELGLMVMFAYDYMYLTHACICESTFESTFEKVEPNPMIKQGDDCTSEVGGDFVEPNPPLEKVEPKSPNIKALIQLINL